MELVWWCPAEDLLLTGLALFAESFMAFLLLISLHSSSPLILTLCWLSGSASHTDPSRNLDKKLFVPLPSHTYSMYRILNLLFLHNHFLCNLRHLGTMVMSYCWHSSSSFVFTLTTSFSISVTCKISIFSMPIVSFCVSHVSSMPLCLTHKFLPLLSTLARPDL